jgi:hypothetical protein
MTWCTEVSTLKLTFWIYSIYFLSLFWWLTLAHLSSLSSLTPSDRCEFLSFTVNQCLIKLLQGRDGFLLHTDSKYKYIEGQFNIAWELQIIMVKTFMFSQPIKLRYWFQVFTSAEVWWNFWLSFQKLFFQNLSF